MVPRREHQRRRSGAGSADTSTEAASGGTGVKVDGSSGPTLDSNCGVTTLGTTRLPPDLLLVFRTSPGRWTRIRDRQQLQRRPRLSSKWNQTTPPINRRS